VQPREKRLLLILGASLFAALNLLGLRALLASRRHLAGEIASCRSALAEQQGWIRAGESLRPAKAWMADHPMPHLGPEDASTQLLKAERDAAEAAGLKVSEETLTSPGDSPYGSTAGVSLKLSGPFQGVVKFLLAVQTPSAWRVVDKLALRSDAQPPNVVADLEIRQYFQQGPSP
jgi:hypothetical protein